MKMNPISAKNLKSLPQNYLKTKSRLFDNTKITSAQNIQSLNQMNDRSTIFLYDKNLLRIPNFKKFINKKPYSISLAAGESLKTLKMYERILGQLLSMQEKIEGSSITLASIGGGSVGDFVGFVASTFKRGLPFINIPTTALAAIDSAHGGKTALNFRIGKKVFKNQIGTFYPASEIWIIQEFFENLSEAALIDAYGEALKISLIEGKDLWHQISHKDDWNAEILTKMLPFFIEAKMKIVRKDPFEKFGVRQILNLGHTLGHVIESDLKISHGMSVLLGLGFAQEWGVHLGITKHKYVDIPNHREALKKIKNLKKLLVQDKKRSGKGLINFIFIERPGRVIRKTVTIDQIAGEVQRQIKGT